MATLPLRSFNFDPKSSVGRYTGQDGPQQSAEEVIWSLPNGLQGTVPFGAWNQRRVDHRLNTASSCVGCHIDGMNRVNNDLREWLDEENGRRLPKGEHGVDGWVNDAATVDRVRELYPPSSEMRAKIESDRRIFLTAMAQIKDAMILGVDKNVYVEPAIWTIEWARDFYGYPVTRSN